MIFYILHNREGMAEYAHAVVLAHVLWAGQSASGVCVLINPSEICLQVWKQILQKMSFLVAGETYRSY